MRIAPLVAALAVAVSGACKRSGNAQTADASPAPSSSSSASTAVDAGRPRTGPERREAELAARLGMSVPPLRHAADIVAVSSRVENDHETPAAIMDLDLDTAWSSKTGDLEGAWVALHVRPEAAIRGVHLTVGLTKDEDLFLQNPRIEQVEISFAGKPIGGRVTLDPGSRTMQRIPIAVHGPGELRITVTKVRVGTKPSWREVSISELALEGTSSTSVGSSLPETFYVGDLSPTPRGRLGLVPELPIPYSSWRFPDGGLRNPPKRGIGCLAMIPSVPRVYCALGTWSSYAVEASIVTLDPEGTTQIIDLTRSKEDGTVGESMIPYSTWVAMEKALVTGGQTLDDKAAKPIPWNGVLETEGVTFRQRETQRGESNDAPPDVQGAVEVRWTADGRFEPFMGARFPVPAGPMVATVRPLGRQMWLVERRSEHGSEGMYALGAEAVLCSAAKRTCAGVVAKGP